LDLLRAARTGDHRAQQIVDRYETMIGAKRENEHMKTLLRKAWAWQHRLDHRPLLTGALLRPSHYNGPLPRMKPQPTHVSMMISRRKVASQRRMTKYDEIQELREDMRVEQTFEAFLAAKTRGRRRESVPHVFRSPYWDLFLSIHTKYLKGIHWRDISRAQKVFSPKLLEQIRAARREKPLNKMRERLRLLRGEVLPATKARSAVTRMKRRSHVKGPPAHVLARMTPEQKRLDRVMREPSEGGYSGMVKRCLGIRLRVGDEFLESENGMAENQPWLNAMETRIHDANLQQRRSAD